MTRRLALGIGVACCIVAVADDVQLIGAAPQARSARPPQAPAASAAAGDPVLRAVLRQYCTACHNQRAKVGGLALDTLDMAHVGENADVWEQVVRKLRTGAMPPAGRPRPDTAVSAEVVTWLETELDRAALEHPNPGRPTLHRLNRSEYRNAVRDLLALDIDASLLPADNAAYGFDNNADALTLSSALTTSRISSTSASATSRSGPARCARPEGVRGDERNRQILESMRFRVPVTAGSHLVQVYFAAKTSAYVEDLFDPYLRRDPYRANGEPAISSVTITGPQPGTAPADTSSGDSPSRRRLFVCTPASVATETEDAAICAHTIISTLARRAYRRPVGDADLEIPLALYRDGASRGGFESGIELAVRGILVSPSFLFRFERQPASIAPNTPYRISDLELASRLSFFLWSSIPDDELVDMAVQQTADQVLAFQADITRVTSFMMARENIDRSYTEIGLRANRTSPVIRGKWILDNILGTPPPPPPPRRTTRCRTTATIRTR